MAGTRRDEDRINGGPGVPEALPRTLRRVVDELGVERVDRLWIFPPLVRGRKEWGLVAASTYTDHDGRRRIFSAPYTAERTGAGLAYEGGLEEEGEAPPDRLPRVMEGVARRGDESLGEPREVTVAGDGDAFEEIMAEFQAEAPEA